MPYTRLYPIAKQSYNPGDNPLQKQTGVTVTDFSADITDVRADYVAQVTTPSEWYVTISQGLNYEVVGSYRVNSTLGLTGLTLDNMDGTAFAPPADSTGSDYVISLFKSTCPSQYDGFAEAFVLTALPAVELEVITRAGQYVAIPAAALIVGAIYNISIAEIVEPDGATGFLLGAEGINGSGLLP